MKRKGEHLERGDAVKIGSEIRGKNKVDKFQSIYK